MQFTVVIYNDEEMAALYVLHENEWRYLDLYDHGRWRYPDDDSFGIAEKSNHFPVIFSCDSMKKARSIALVYFKMQG